MSFDQLKQAILEEADKRAQAVSYDWHKKLVQEENRIKEKARFIEEQVVEQGEVKAEDEARRLNQEAALQMKARMLAAKQAELDLTRDKFKQELLSGDEVKITNLLKGLVKLLPDQPGTLVAGSEHASYLKPLLKKPAIFIDEKTIPNEGGFIYRNDTMELNLTISQLVNELFARHRTDIANTLLD